MPGQAGLAIALLCCLALAGTGAALPFTVPSSLGPFLRFSGRTDDTYTISVLVATKGADPTSCLRIDFVDGLGGLGKASLASASDPALLYTHGDMSFVRWIVSINMGLRETAVKYHVSSTCSTVAVSRQTGGTYTFYVPGRLQSWRWAYYSCNGFHEPSLSPKRGGGGVKPLWKDLWAQHGDRKLHLIAGNGDQLYNDPFLKSNATIKAAAIDSRTPDTVVNFQWTPELKTWTDDWFYASYAHHWMLASDDYRRALASVPFTMMWDDHDVFNGFGSQVDIIRSSPFYTEVAAVATKYYLLFQQHSTETDMMPDLTANGGGPAHSVVSLLGPHTAMAVPDTRGERTPRQVLSDGAWDNFRTRLFDLPDGMRHLVVLSPMPLALSVNSVDKLLVELGAEHGIATWADLQDKWIDAGFRPIVEDLLAKLNVKLRFLFGAPDLSDVVDQWDSLDHAAEREKFVTILQEWAAAYKARVTVLSGDSHIAFASEFFTTPTTPGGARLPAANDPKYMFAATSSAIGNVPATGLAKLLELTAWQFKEAVDAAGSTTVKHRPVFLGVPRVPLGSIFTVARRNYLLVQEPRLSTGLQLTWRLERFVNETELPAASRSWTVPAYAPA